MTDEAPTKPLSKAWGPAILFGTAVFIPVFFFSHSIIPPRLPFPIKIFWPLFIALSGAAIIKTGKVSPWRATLFVTITLGFIIHFKSGLLNLPYLKTAENCAKEAPYCHIALAPTALNFVYQQYLAFMSGNWALWGPLSLGFLWLALTLTLGRGWCSWVCFYGGIDEGFGKILPKPPVKLNLPRKLRDFPAALLVFLLLVSVSYFLPIFCLWLCPLKMTTSFLDPDASIKTVQTWLMLATGIIFLILLPLLTGKRTFCGLICPFGAWQSFFGKINPFRVTLDTSKCSACGQCAEICPTLAIHQQAKDIPEILDYCNMCGKCIDGCPGNSIRYTVLGGDLPPSAAGRARLWSAKTLFVFSALVIAGTLGSLFVPAAAADLIRWILYRP